MSIVERLKQLMIDQGIETELIDKYVNTQAVAVMVKQDLKQHDLFTKNKGKNATTHTSAITLTGSAMNIFIDNKIVYEQDEQTCKGFKNKVDVILIGQNIMHLDRGNSINISGGEIPCYSHIGIRHKKAPTKNQLYLGRVSDDATIFNTFRGLLLLGDTLVILRLRENSFCILGFPGQPFKEYDRIIYKEVRRDATDGDESIYSRISVTDYDETEFEETELDDETTVSNHNIDLKAYENDTILIDTTKECLKDLMESNNLRTIRKNRHNRLVAYFGRFIEKKGYTAQMNQSVDLLFQKNENTVVVCEMKTLNGGSTDLRAQALKAFAQLFYYKMYKLGEYSSAENIDLAVVFEDSISKEYIRFFEEHNISVFWKEGDGFNSSDSSKNMFL